MGKVCLRKKTVQTYCSLFIQGYQLHLSENGKFEQQVKGMKGQVFKIQTPWYNGIANAI